MKQEVHIIAAVGANGAIGRRGDLLWHLPGDLKRFKELTMGHPIIMGRKTFESFPRGPLPGRRNVVITRRKDYPAEGIDVVHSLEEALQLTAAEPEVYIIGGGEIYGQALPLATHLDLTLVDDSPEDADTFFPVLPEGWTETEGGAWSDTSPRFRYASFEKSST